MSTRLPAHRNARLAKHWASGGEPTPCAGEPQEPMFPLMIFSHGLGGTRTTYSTLCGNFASYGFIVCALEHRDGSGPSTYVNTTNQKSEDSSEPGKEQGGPGRKDYEKLDYVFPKGNAYDTRPSNERGVDAELRTAQIQLRLAEIEEAYYVLSKINDGEGEIVALENLRRPGHIGSSSQGLDGVDWQSWKGRGHLDQVTVAGHSFGGATAVEVLRHPDRFGFVGQGIIYDIWGAAIQPPEDKERSRTKRPLLCINSEAFMYWPTNFEAVLTLCQEAKANHALTWLMTVRGTVHLSLSDFSLLYPRIFSFFLKAMANPHRAILLHVHASFEFLKLVTPRDDAVLKTIHTPGEELLRIAPLDRLPDERRPADERWIAMRLRIPHEMTLRLKPRVVRRYEYRKKAEQEGKCMPRDASGKDVDALQDLPVGEEVWMHFAPEPGELASLGSEPGTGQRTGHGRGD